MQNITKRSVGRGSRLKSYEDPFANEISAVCKAFASSISNDILESINYVSSELDKRDDVDSVVTFFELATCCRTVHLIIFHVPEGFDRDNLENAIKESYYYDNDGWTFFDLHNEKLYVLYKASARR